MLKALIVEGDLMIADPAEDIVIENRYKVCGIAHTLMRGPAIIQRTTPGRSVFEHWI